PTTPNSATVIAAIFVILGHNWSIFAYMVTGKLRGGKGAATAFGTFLIISPPLLTVVMLATGITILVRTRYMSLAVLVMTFIASGSLVVLGLIPDNAQNQAHMIYALTLGGMIFYRHRENIKRLLAGNERRVGERA
ncbi:MAG: glycerol-3-phosphate acyltransferase, partial [Chloroflexota bacterium]